MYTTDREGIAEEEPVIEVGASEPLKNSSQAAIKQRDYWGGAEVGVEDAQSGGIYSLHLCFEVKYFEL